MLALLLVLLQKLALLSWEFKKSQTILFETSKGNNPDSQSSVTEVDAIF